MKKSLLAFIPASLLMLASCGLIGNLPIDDEDGDDPEYSQGSQEEFKEPSIEELAKKYSGFEITYNYTYTNDIISIGGKGNTYWYASGKKDNPYSTATITTVNGSSYENVSYSSGEKYTLDDTETNMAALIGDSNYLGYGQHGGILEDYKYESATIGSEAAKKYTIANMEIYVSKEYGCTLQIDYADGDAIKFVGIKKGNAVEVVKYE